MLGGPVTARVHHIAGQSARAYLLRKGAALGRRELSCEGSRETGVDEAASSGPPGGRGLSVSIADDVRAYTMSNVSPGSVPAFCRNEFSCTRWLDSLANTRATLRN